MMSDALKYIREAAGGYAVRIGSSTTGRISLGTFPTLEAAQAARNAHLGYDPDMYASREAADMARALTLDSISIPAAAPGDEHSIPLRLSSDSALILGDLHCPHHHALMLQRAIWTCKAHHPAVDTAVIIGDFYDFASLSRFPKTERHETAEGTVTNYARPVLRAIASHFKRLVLLPGNHCWRFAKALGEPFSFKSLVEWTIGREPLDCEIVTTELDYVYIGREWMAGHPRTFSGQGGKTPSDLADKYRCNMITGHNHAIGMATSKSGYLGIDCGHLTKPRLHGYYNSSLTKYPRWQSGYVILDNGKPHIFTEQWTDWDRVLNRKAA